MTWSYSPDDLNTNPIDQVRFMIGDTDPNMPYLQNEEIAFLLQLSGGNVISASIMAVRRIIAYLTKEVDYKIGPEKVNASQRLKNYLDLLAQLQQESSSVTNMQLSQPVTHPPIFYIGMDDNHYTWSFLYMDR